MVRAKYFNKNIDWLTLSPRNYYCLAVLKVESKYWTNIKLRLERNRRRTRIAEWPPTSVN